MMRAMATIAAALLAMVLALALSESAFAQSGAARPPAAQPNRVAAPGEKTAPAAPAGPPPDMAFCAFQRGYFITAFSLATDRVPNGAEPNATPLLARLYAEGFGVPQADGRPAEWYGLAAARGDSN